MSYEIIRSIKIKDGQVFIKGAPNNVYPRDYEEFECPSLTKILKDEGQEKLDIEILKEFESGNFQGSIGKYTRPLAILRHLPEYADFDWRQNGPGYERAEINRKTPAFDELLKKVLSMKTPREKYIIKKDYFGRVLYLRSARRSARWTDDKTRAKVFHYAADAEGLGKCYTNGESWIVERIA
jgi:hypothetical protein